jgi:hypothetical protein
MNNFYYLVLNREESHIEVRNQIKMDKIKTDHNYIVINPKRPYYDLITAAKAAVRRQYGL